MSVAIVTGSGGFVAFAAFHAEPKAAAVYNIGGGRDSNCSLLEAIALCERIAGVEILREIHDQNVETWTVAA
jgi:CDP-paratose 2-epimerase